MRTKAKSPGQFAYKMSTDISCTECPKALMADPLFAISISEIIRRSEWEFKARILRRSFPQPCHTFFFFLTKHVGRDQKHFKFVPSTDPRLALLGPFSSSYSSSLGPSYRWFSLMPEGIMCSRWVCGRALMSLFGRWTDLNLFTQIHELRQHFNVSDVAWYAWTQQVGHLGEDIRVLAALPRSAIIAGCGAAQYLDGSPFTPATATQIGLVWRLAKRVVAEASGLSEDQFVDQDPWAETNSQQVNAPSSTPQSSGVKERVLKMANIIDQGDDSELLPPTSMEINNWLQNYMSVMGAPPQESEEPSPNQLAGLAKRVFRDDGPPYCDFGIYGPYERKLSKTLRCRIYTPLGDGTFLQRELPGPPTFQAWQASWRVFRTSCLMLDIVNLAALEIYGNHIERLVVQWPACWGLIYAADDLARAERLQKLRRQFTVEEGLGRQVPRGWNQRKPWSCLFTEITRDDSFWSEKVHIPASAWVAAGSRGAPVVATEAAVKSHLSGVQDNVEQLPDGKDDRRRQANRDKRVAKRRRMQENMQELRSFRSSRAHGDKDPGPGQSSGSKGGGKSKGKSKDQAGSPLCFSWASGSGPRASVPPGGECLCPVKRVHKCRKCLSPAHQDDACTKSWSTFKVKTASRGYGSETCCKGIKVRFEFCWFDSTVV